MRHVALILIALAAGTGNSWAQSPEIDSLVAVSRNRELNDAPRLVALDSLAARTLRILRANPSAKTVSLPENALRTESPDGRIAVVTLTAPTERRELRLPRHRWTTGWRKRYGLGSAQ